MRSRSADDTRAIGAAIAAVLEPGDVVILSGDLGAGKTTFVQGAALALGVTRAVQSPSFVLVREYPGVVHADVYRLNSLQELIDLGDEDLFDGVRIAFVEWGDAVADLLPADRLEVDIRGDGDERLVSVTAAGSAWDARVARLRQAVAEWER